MWHYINGYFGYHDEIDADGVALAVGTYSNCRTIHKYKIGRLDPSDGFWSRYVVQRHNPSF